MFMGSVRIVPVVVRGGCAWVVRDGKGQVEGGGSEGVKMELHVLTGLHGYNWLKWMLFCIEKLWKWNRAGNIALNCGII